MFRAKKNLIMVTLAIVLFALLFTGCKKDEKPAEHPKESANKRTINNAATAAEHPNESAKEHPNEHPNEPAKENPRLPRNEHPNDHPE